MSEEENTDHGERPGELAEIRDELRRLRSDIDGRWEQLREMLRERQKMSAIYALCLFVCLFGIFLGMLSR